MDIDRQIEALEASIEEANRKLIKLETDRVFLKSFEAKSTVYALVRRSIDTGSLEKVIGIFTSEIEAIRFANGTPGYGLGKDLFIDDYPLF